MIKVSSDVVLVRGPTEVYKACEPWMLCEAVAEQSGGSQLCSYCLVRVR